MSVREKLTILVVKNGFDMDQRDPMGFRLYLSRRTRRTAMLDQQNQSHAMQQEQINLTAIKTSRYTYSATHLGRNLTTNLTLKSELPKPSRHDPYI